MILSMNFNWLRVALASLVLLPLAAISQSGYITRPVGADQMDLMSVPFYVTGGNDVMNIFPDVGTTYNIYFWDTPLQVWNSYYKTDKGWVPPPREILPGEAFFLHSDINQDISIGGTIPTPPRTNEVSYKPCILAYPYPQDVLWTNTQLSALLPEGSIVSFWNRGSNCWHPAFLKAPAAKGGGWGNTANNYVIHAGDGFAVQQGPGGTNFNWVE